MSKQLKTLNRIHIAHRIIEYMTREKKLSLQIITHEDDLFSGGYKLLPGTLYLRNYIQMTDGAHRSECSKWHTTLKSSSENCSWSCRKDFGKMKTSQRTKAKSLERIHKTKGNTDRTRVAYSMTTGKNAEVLESLLQMWMAGKKSVFARKKSNGTQNNDLSVDQNLSC